MAYTTIDKPDDYFNTLTWTGDNTDRTISGVGFQPDWIWWKQRNGTDDHRLIDSVRGEGTTSYKILFSNTTDAEYDGNDNGGSQGNINAITSDGFSGVQGTVGWNNWNGSGNTYVGWNWLANGAGVSNTQGSIASTVSANTTSGFSIVSYTGNATSGATVGHGLGAVPKMIIVKKRNGATNWTIYNSNLSTGASSYLYLNTTDAEGTSYAGYWNSTTPTSSVFTLGNAADTNGNTDTYIAYCFAEKKGFSKFGSYTGNGNADGTFVYTGFKPAWVMYKASSISGQSWLIHDNKRGNQGANANPQDLRLLANATNTEADVDIDFLSNGFKPRAGDPHINSSGTTYIYMAFAENPFVTSTSIPTTAR
jgi:hypothetical protein